MHTLLAAALAFVVVLVQVEVACARCAPDAVEVGPTCVDRYEASIWRIPAGAVSLLTRVRKGKATLDDLLAAGATQIGAASTAPWCLDELYSTGFPPDGNWTEPLYGLSVAGVLPSTCVTWFQAEQACALAGKRLVTNQEWQRAVAGTPDPDGDDGVADCNRASVLAPVLTGSRTACQSKWGAFDMVGNVSEITGDWDERADGGCSTVFGSDTMCIGGGGNGDAAAPFRGGYWGEGTANTGPFNLNLSITLTNRFGHIGFRCAR
jgi:hypothetical protein